MQRVTNNTAPIVFSVWLGTCTANYGRGVSPVVVSGYINGSQQTLPLTNYAYQPLLNGAAVILTQPKGSVLPVIIGGMC